MHIYAIITIHISMFYLPESMLRNKDTPNRKIAFKYNNVKSYTKSDRKK